MMAAYSMRGTEKKSPKRKEVEVRQHGRQTVLSARRAGGSARVTPAWWPTAANIHVKRMSTVAMGS